jgi:hypothetical protein
LSFVLRAGGASVLARAAILSVLGALLVFIGLIGGSSAAGAAVIPNAITGIQTTATSTGQYDRVDFTCQWAVPDGSMPGDTFTLALPAQLRWLGATQFALRAPDGKPVATAKVSASGLVTFTLTDYVATHSTSVHGTCQFSTQYTATTSGGAVNLDFQLGSSVIRVPIDTDEPCTQNCGPDRTVASKAMWWTDTGQDTTQSVVRAPKTTSQKTSIVLTDVPGPGLALDCATLRSTIGRVLNSDNEVIDPTDDAAYPATVSCTPQGATATWSHVPAGEYAELWVDATVADTSLTEYTNRGSVTLNGVDAPVQGHVVRTDASGTGDGVIPTATPTTSTPSSTTTTSTPSSTTTTSTPSSTTTTSTPSSTTTTSRPATTTPDTASTPEVGGVEAPAAPSSLAFTGAMIWRTAAAGVGALLLGLAVQLALRRRTR